jgi:hypothetical protein
MDAKTLKEARKKWEEHCKRIDNITSEMIVESPDERKKNIQLARKDYAYFCKRYFPHYCKCENAEFHNRAAKKIKDNPNLKGLFKWPRGHAKSTHIDIMTPLWLKFQEEPQIHLMVLVSKSEDAADKLLSDLQAELQYNKYLIRDFGQQFKSGSWEEGDFVDAQGVAYHALGRGQSPRGLRNHENRPDYIVIDDFDDDEIIKNEKRVQDAADWVTDALFGALDGGHGRFIMVGNLISHNSVLEIMSKKKSMYVDMIQAYDKNGDPSWPQKYTKKDLQDYEEFVGYRSFQREMMHNPITVGKIFKRDWIKWKKPLKLNQYEMIIAYLDPSWKPGKKDDYKACKVWGKPKRGIPGTSPTELHCLYAFVRQSSIGEIVRWLYDLYESTPNIGIQFYMEASFMQDTLLDDFTAEGDERGYQLPIRGDKRAKPNKEKRIEDISPLWERGFVFYNIDMQEDIDMKAGIEMTLEFEHGMRGHDDGPDADEGAIWMLQRSNRRERNKPTWGYRQTSKNMW